MYDVLLIYSPHYNTINACFVPPNYSLAITTNSSSLILQKPEALATL
jgi:hypothetical protein